MSGLTTAGLRSLVAFADALESVISEEDVEIREEFSINVVTPDGPATLEYDPVTRSFALPIVFEAGES